MSAAVGFGLVSLGACAGYLLGTSIRNTVFASQPWKFLRWDENILGYRTVSESYSPLSSDVMLMAVEVETSDPEELKIK